MSMGGNRHRVSSELVLTDARGWGEAAKLSEPGSYWFSEPGTTVSSPVCIVRGRTAKLRWHLFSVSVTKRKPHNEP